MADRFDLIKASTLDPKIATVRITQIYRRPSLEIPFLDNTSEWYEHFIKNYNGQGDRIGYESYSPDKLTLTYQVYWISEEKWLAASDHDPVAIENEKRHMAYCAQYGISHTRIREIKKDGKWWANIITQVDNQWEQASIGSLIAPQHTPLALPDQTVKKVLLPNETKAKE